MLFSAIHVQYCMRCSNILAITKPPNVGFELLSLSGDLRSSGYRILFFRDILGELHKPLKDLCLVSLGYVLTVK